MKTRLKDVAEKLNLSQALVSGVLNNRPNAWASAETKARIFEAAKELNYQPSAAAQALSSGKSNTVAFVYRRLQGHGFRLAYTGLVDVFSAEMQAIGRDLLVSNFATQEEVLTHLEKLVRTRTADAFILWGREQDTLAQGLLLDSLRAPFLIKGRFEEIHPDWFQVDFDHEWMIGEATRQLVELGHTRLAYIGFTHEDAYVQSLRKGFVKAHTSLLGFEPISEMVAACEDDVLEVTPIIDRWLSLPQSDRPTGFVIGAGNAAWLSLETSLAQHGLHLTLAESAVKEGCPSAAGIAADGLTLMFGEGEAYQGIELDNLARYVSPRLIDSVIAGQDGARITRFRPNLTRVPSLNLLSHGVAFQKLAPQEEL